MLVVTFERPGPLTLEYYEHLAECLGDDWVRLAKALGLRQPAVPRIIQSNAHIDNTSESKRQSAKNALIQWHRSAAKSANKVITIIRSFVCGRSGHTQTVRTCSNVQLECIAHHDIAVLVCFMQLVLQTSQRPLTLFSRLCADAISFASQGFVCAQRSVLCNQLQHS